MLLVVLMLMLVLVLMLMLVLMLTLKVLMFSFKGGPKVDLNVSTKCLVLISNVTDSVDKKPQMLMFVLMRSLKCRYQ
jgi:hypothetical protein